MRPLSFLILAAGGLVLSCGGGSAPSTPESSLESVLETFHAPAAAFAEQVRKEFEDNDFDVELFQRSAGFPALLVASQELLPDFVILGDDQDSLGYFADCLGHVNRALDDWQVKTHPDPASTDTLLASIEFPDGLGFPDFFVRLARGQKLDWKLASWPPLQRWAFQGYSPGAVRLRLHSWDSGDVPEQMRSAMKAAFGAEVPAGASLSQVTDWEGHPLSSPASDDPWSVLQYTVQDYRTQFGAPDAGGVPTRPIYLLADPRVPASLLLGVLETLARESIHWPSVWLGAPGEILDVYCPLEQQFAGKAEGESMVLTGGASEAEWTAALAGSNPGNPVGLRLDPVQPVSSVIADLERLKRRGFTRAFIVLPVKQE